MSEPQLPPIWKVVSLEDLLSDPKDLTYGVVQPGSPVSDGVPIVRVKDVRGGTVHCDEPLRIAPGIERDYERSRLRGGELLVTLVGTVGEVAVVPAEMSGWNTARAVAVVRLSSPEEARWVGYCIRSPDGKERIAARVNTTVQTTLNLKDLREFPVPLPPIRERRAIAGVLEALDDKIESTRRLVRLSEAVGRAELARELAGAEGQPWEHAWPDVPLGSALSLIETGDRPKGGVAGIAGGVPSVGAESIVAPGVFDFSKTKYVPRDYFERMRRGVLSSGDVLLYKDGGTPGNFIPKVSMYQDGFPFDEAVLNSHVYRLRISQPYSQGFLYYWLSSERLLDEMWLRGTGAAIPSLNSTNVKGLPLAVPPEDRLRKVLPIVDDLLALLHRTARQQRTLEQLRDALLPELLSGRLRVREAENVIEGVM